MENNSTKKRCSRCGQEKPLADFGGDASRKDGLNKECRECRRQRYQQLHGGLQQALRRFTDSELIGEVLRRDAVYELLESLDPADIAAYLLCLGCQVTLSPRLGQKREGGTE